MVLVGKVNSYTIIYAGGGKTKLNFKATIELFDAKENRIGVLYFYKDSNDLPSNDKKDQDDIVHSYFLGEEYLKILDLLREDDSVFLHFIEDRKVGVLSTSDEHVGEHVSKF